MKPDRDKLRAVAEVAKGLPRLSRHVTLDVDDLLALLDEAARYEKALRLVLAEADNNKCNEMDSLITCVNLAEDALKWPVAK